jgi:hypothetical protein
MHTILLMTVALITLSDGFERESRDRYGRDGVTARWVEQRMQEVVAELADVTCGSHVYGFGQG